MDMERKTLVLEKSRHKELEAIISGIGDQKQLQLDVIYPDGPWWAITLTWPQAMKLVAFITEEGKRERDD